jgi:hypothetical protein
LLLILSAHPHFECEFAALTQSLMLAIHFSSLIPNWCACSMQSLRKLQMLNNSRMVNDEVSNLWGLSVVAVCCLSLLLVVVSKGVSGTRMWYVPG